VRFFTPEGANAELAEVRPLAERLVAARAAYREQEAALQAVRAKIASNGGGLDPRAIRRAEEALQTAASEIGEAIEAITARGAQVKDLEAGLVDFPAKHPDDGSIVLLCWQVGEDAVAHWHGLEEGFAGRKPLPF
jgi:hypothetical protein